jgi:hypothetical protein
VRIVKGFARFWYDFIVGDDWKIAAAVVVALLGSALMMSLTAVGAGWPPAVAGAAIFAAFTLSLVVDVRRSS